jgi:hypothetical protein
MISFTGNIYGLRTSCKTDLEWVLLHRLGSLYSYLTCKNKLAGDAMSLDPVQPMEMYQ